MLSRRRCFGSANMSCRTNATRDCTGGSPSEHTRTTRSPRVDVQLLTNERRRLVNTERNRRLDRIIGERHEQSEG
jgi:hypothetical protein